MAPISSAHEFGQFRLDSAERLLVRGGRSVPLTPKAFDLLVVLVQRRGRLVTKQELMAALWPNTFVEEANLTYTVSALRKALGDGHDGEQFIQTVPTRGYRFVAPVRGDRDATAEAVPHESNSPRLNLPARIAIGVLAIALVALISVVVRPVRDTPVGSPPARFTIPLPESLTARNTMVTPQISPDGRHVAFLVGHVSQIWLHDMVREGARPLPGTEDARSLFWGPDSDQLAFGTPSSLKKISLADGTVQTLCNACRPAGGGTWSRSGQIIFPAQEGPLLAIHASGGEPSAVTSLDHAAGDLEHRAPFFLPDSQRFLYVARNRDEARSVVRLGKLGATDHRPLLTGAGPIVFAPPGYVLFLRNGTLMAQRFDVRRLALTGEASALATGVIAPYSLPGQPALSVSDTGVLTYGTIDRPVSQFRWVGRAGEPHELVGAPGQYFTFDLSPDGRHLVYAYAQSEGGQLTLSVLDIERGVPSRLTTGDSSYADPRWTDGPRVVATRWRPRPIAIVAFGLDGAESTIISSTEATNMVDDVSRDGKYLLFRSDKASAWHLLAAPLTDASEPIVVRIGATNQARFAPESRFVAYQERDDAGRWEVWVTPFPPTGERWQVSAVGGVQPVWREDGRELYYLGMDGVMNVVESQLGTPPFSPPRRLFATRLVPPSTSGEDYTVSRDGQRFLLLEPMRAGRSSIRVIHNWPGLLSRPAP